MAETVTEDLYRAKIHQLQPDANAVLISEWSPHAFDALKFVQQNCRRGDDVVIEAKGADGVEEVVTNRKGMVH